MQKLDDVAFIFNGFLGIISQLSPLLPKSLIFCFQNMPAWEILCLYLGVYLKNLPLATHLSAVFPLTVEIPV